MSRDQYNEIRKEIKALSEDEQGKAFKTGDPYNEIRKEIEDLEDELEKAFRTPEGIKKFQSEHYCADIIDIHASGWSYTFEESLMLAYTQAKYNLTPEVIHYAKKYEHINVVSEYMVITVTLHETYYAVPNEQELARKAGTASLDPYALLEYRADQKAPLGPGAGEGRCPNPYRDRETRVWVKIGGKWKIALSQRTRIGERLRVDMRVPE